MMMLPRRNFGLDLFDEMFQDPFFTSRIDTMKPSIMKTDIQEKDGKYIMDIDMPGIPKENIQIQLEDGYLTISANHDEQKEEKDEKGNYIYQERHTGQCSRTFYVGNAVTQEDIKANYKNGILQLNFPKKDTQQLENKTKYIAIE